MYKPITLITCFVLSMLINVVLAQEQVKTVQDEYSKRDTKTYDIKSLDGQNQKVHIMPDYPKHILRMSCLKDTISITDYWGVPVDIHVLNNNFIELDYAIRGGSNLSLGNMIVLCVNKNKLYEAMHVLRHMDSELSYIIDSKKFHDHSNYNIKVTLSGNNKNNYKLNVNVHDYEKSTTDPDGNYNYDNLSILSFDADKNVFYSVKDGLYGTFKLYHNGRHNKTKQNIRGDFPVIILGKEFYYFIKDGWYTRGQNDQLDGYTSRTTK